jgi:hypothetical protein
MNSDPTLMVRLDLDAIRLRHRRAVDRTPPSALDASAADIPQLVSEVERLGALVLESRLAHANLRAAVRAALSAARDGEPEPFGYLTDELYGEWPTARGDRGRR